MRFCNLGTTDIQVSTVALGCWAFAGGKYWGEQEDQDSINTVAAALDAQINFFDTAEAYGGGYSEEILAQALGKRSNDVIIASKFGGRPHSHDQVIEACEQSLHRLKRDYIDLYQIHWPDETVPIEETMTALNRLKQQGKIRAIGVCNFGHDTMQELLGVGSIETNQVAYNLLWRGLEYEIAPNCIEHGIGILCYSPLAQGLLTGKYHSADDVPQGRARTKLFASSRPQTRHGQPGHEELAFRTIDRIRTIAQRHEVSMTDLSLWWLFKQSGVTAVLAGARNAQQILENAKCTEIDLPDSVATELSEASDELKQAVGGDTDIWANRIS